MSDATNRLREVGEYLVLQADLTSAYRTTTGPKPNYDCSDLGGASPSVLSWARRLGNQLIEDAGRYAKQDGADEVSMVLLGKLAEGGGRRTGALRRAGFIEWTITESGRRALEDFRSRIERKK